MACPGRYLLFLVAAVHMARGKVRLEVPFVVRAVARFVIAAAGLALASYAVPGLISFRFSAVLLTAAVLVALELATEGWWNRLASRGRRFAVFATSAVAIYCLQYLVKDWVRVTILGAVMASLLIDMIDRLFVVYEADV